jgi:hypothetical protein
MPVNKMVVEQICRAKEVPEYIIPHIIERLNIELFEDAIWNKALGAEPESKELDIVYYL